MTEIPDELMELVMSEDKIKFEHPGLGGDDDLTPYIMDRRSWADLKSPEPLCETSVRTAPVALTVEPGTDGGFAVREFGGGVAFAAGTLEEVLEYIQDRFS